MEMPVTLICDITDTTLISGSDTEYTNSSK